MADKRISQLDELTTPGSSDVLAIVNSGTTKKIQNSNYTLNVRNSNTALTASSLVVNNFIPLATASISSGTITFTKTDDSTFDVPVTAATASYIQGSNVDGAVTLANTASYVAAGNIDGTVANATLAVTSNTASYVEGANVDGAVASATLATTANTASYVAAGNIDGTVANATAATTATTASYVEGANIDGAVTLATTATTANTASYIQGANIDSPITGMHFEGANVVTGSFTFSGSDSAAIFQDNAVAAFGDNSDMLIYHDSNNSIISDAGTGNIQIQSNTTIIKNNSNKTAITAVSNAGTTINHNNSERFKTTADGVQVIGDTNASGSMVNRIRTLTASDTPYTVVDEDYTLIVASASTVTINLPASSAKPGRVLVVRTKHDSSAGNITRDGSDQIDDGSGLVSAVAVDAGKARIIQSNGTGIWYSISGVGT
jgi:hypothetical protein